MKNIYLTVPAGCTDTNKPFSLQAAKFNEFVQICQT